MLQWVITYCYWNPQPVLLDQIPWDLRNSMSKVWIYWISRFLDSTFLRNNIVICRKRVALGSWKYECSKWYEFFHSFRVFMPTIPYHSRRFQIISKFLWLFGFCVLLEYEYNIALVSVHEKWIGFTRFFCLFFSVQDFHRWKDSKLSNLIANLCSQLADLFLFWNFYYSW